MISRDDWMLVIWTSTEFAKDILFQVIQPIYMMLQFLTGYQHLILAIQSG